MHGLLNLTEPMNFTLRAESKHICSDIGSDSFKFRIKFLVGQESFPNIPFKSLKRQVNIFEFEMTSNTSHFYLFLLKRLLVSSRVSARNYRF